MNTVLDLMGSLMIAGMLLLGFARFSGDRQAAMLEANNNVSNQTLMSSFTTVMMSDLRKCGYGCKNEAFLTIQKNKIVFLADIDNNTVIDTVKYWFSDAVTSTPNPSDTLLYRQVNNGTAVGSSLGIVSFRFRYYNASGAETTSQIAVVSVGVEARLQSLFPVVGKYQESRAAFRITPKNNK